MVVYKPYKGKDQELLPAMKASYLDLGKGSYVTSQPPMVMKALDGSIILIFEWIEKQKKEEAQVDPVIQQHWMTLSKISECEKAMTLVEFQHPRFRI